MVDLAASTPVTALWLGCAMAKQVAPRESATSRSYLVVAEHARSLEDVVDALRALVQAGHEVRMVVRYGKFGPMFKGLQPRLILASPPPAAWGSRAWSRARRTSDRLLAHRAAVSSVRNPFIAALRHDPRFFMHLRDSDTVIVVGPGPGAEALLTAPRPPWLGTRELLTKADLLKLELDVIVEQVAVLVGGEPPGVRARDGARLARALRAQAVSPAPLGDDARATVAELVAELQSKGIYGPAWEVAAIARLWDSVAEPDVAAEHDVLWALAELSSTGVLQGDVAPLASALMQAVDRSLDAGDSTALARRLTLVLRLMFHRELHADTEHSPLVDDPETFLAPLRSSRAWRRLQDGTDRPPRAFDRRAGERPRVAVLPGSYGKFAVPVAAALGAVADVDIVDVTARRLLVGLGVHPDIVAARVAQALGCPWQPDYVILESMEAADAVFIDWADRGAVLAIMSAPSDVRVVLRIHSMDALSPWIHLIDWTRVDALVFVSEHIRDAVQSQLGDALLTTELHVIPNVIEFDRFDRVKLPGAERTLALVGWGQRVKDPMWALEVLAQLRAEDSAWRLLLIGRDFAQDSVASSQAYAARFRERLGQPDVAGGVDFVPYTDDVPGVLAGVGYIISSSIRESFHIGLTEGAAAGAVPVVRDWPMFAGIDGARRLFPGAWVVSSVDEAADRILRTADRDDWGLASDRARHEVRDIFPYDDVAERLCRVVLGR